MNSKPTLLSDADMSAIRDMEMECNDTLNDMLCYGSTMQDEMAVKLHKNFSVLRRLRLFVVEQALAVVMMRRVIGVKKGHIKWLQGKVSSLERRVAQLESYQGTERRRGVTVGWSGVDCNERTSVPRIASEDSYHGVPSQTFSEIAAFAADLEASHPHLGDVGLK
jgi:hypothetical protein